MEHTSETGYIVDQMDSSNLQQQRRSWSWQEHREQSPLIKQILQIRNIIVEKNGSINAAIMCLNHWFGGTTGVSRAYDFFVGKVGMWPWKPILWKSSILPKHRFALWMFSHGKFLTKDRLGDLMGKKCVLCSEKNETFSHLFFECVESKKIWNNIRIWLGMKKIMGTATAVLKAYKRSYRGNSTLAKMRCAGLASCVYHIWNARNKAIFENEKMKPSDIDWKIKCTIFRCIPGSMEI